MEITMFTLINDKDSYYNMYKVLHKGDSLILENNLQRQSSFYH